MSLPESVTDPLDRDLIAALGEGGGAAREAWSVLVRRHSPRMYAVARSFAIDAQTAEDLVQTAWLRLLSRSDQLRDPQAVGPWLCMIVRNEARRLTTRRREIPAEAPIEHRPALTDAPDARMLRAERDQAVRLAFSNLGAECRQLLRLMLADPPLSYDEIAVAVDRPRGSLGPTRRRCLRRLREFLPPGYET